MTYRQQMESAIKAYMKSIGFKYDKTCFTYYKEYNDDVEASMIYGQSSHGFKSYYDLNIGFHLRYKSWNNLLFELTDGFTNLNQFRMGMFGFSYPLEENKDNPLQYSMTFSAQRSIEENMEEFRQIVESWGIPFWDKFSNKDSLYSYLLMDEYAYAFSDWSEYSFPVTFFMKKDYEQSLQYAKKFLEGHKQEVRRNPHADGLVSLLDRYKVFYKNLKKMIESQADYQQKDPFTKIKETMKKIFTIALIISASISLHAQQPKRVVKFVFQTDKSGSIVKRIPVFEEEKEKKDLKILKHLSVKPQNGGVKVYVTIPDIDHYQQCELLVHNTKGERMAQYPVNQQKSEFTASQLETGVYIISLQADNKLLETAKTVSR